MKVKELKEILKGVNDDYTIIVVDSDDKGLEVVGGGELNGGSLCLRVRQEFPDAWYDEDGQELRWINSVGVSSSWNEEREEILLHDEEEFGDSDEHYVTLTFRDGEASGDGVYVSYPKLADLTDEQIEEIDRYTGGRISDSCVVTPYDVCLVFGKVKVVGVFDSVSHDRNLVKELNLKWVKYKQGFKPILCALYERDLEEIYNNETFDIEGSMDDVFAELQKRWDYWAENYLMHIADDQDLEIIIKFVRCDVCEDGMH